MHLFEEPVKLGKVGVCNRMVFRTLEVDWTNKKLSNETLG
jgi:hypothetical protein